MAILLLLLNFFLPFRMQEITGHYNKGINAGTITGPKCQGSAVAGGANNSVTSSAVDCTGANFYVVRVETFGTAATNVTLSDSVNGSYTSHTTDTAGTSSHGVWFYILGGSAGASQTWTVQCTAGNCGGNGFPSISFSGWNDTATPVLDATNSNTTFSGSTIQTGSVTPAVNNELLLAGFGSLASASSACPTINSSFTAMTCAVSISANNDTTQTAYLIQMTAAAINPTWDATAMSGEVDGMADIITFKP